VLTRTTNNVETLQFTTEQSPDILTTAEEDDMHGVIVGTGVTIDPTDRIVTRVKVFHSGGAANLSLIYEGTTLSGLQFPQTIAPAPSGFAAGSGLVASTNATTLTYSLNWAEVAATNNALYASIARMLAVENQTSLWNSVSANAITNAASAGSGSSLINSIVSGVLKLMGLKGGTGISVTSEGGTNLIISATASGLSATNPPVLFTNLYLASTSSVPIQITNVLDFAGPKIIQLCPGETTPISVVIPTNQAPGRSLWVEILPWSVTQSWIIPSTWWRAGASLTNTLAPGQGGVLSVVYPDNSETNAVATWRTLTR
jgi:hypothetical protein